MDQRSVAFPLARAIQGRLITNARLEPFACTWGGAEGGAAHFLKAFREDASALSAVEVDTITTVAAQALDVVSADLGVDVSRWTGLEERDVEPWQAPYQQDFLCLKPGQEGQCSFDPSKDVPISAAQSAVHSITSTRGSSWPFSVDFSDNGGRWALLAPGIHERPDNVHFDDRVPAIVTKGLGDIQGIPASALDLAEVSVSSEESFTWSP